LAADELLLQRGADKSLGDHNGRNASEIAAQHGHQENCPDVGLVNVLKAT
jgi:hypothetical protein